MTAYRHYIATYENHTFKDCLIPETSFQIKSIEAGDYFPPGFIDIERQDDIEIDSDVDFGALYSAYGN